MIQNELNLLLQIRALLDDIIFQYRVRMIHEERMLFFEFMIRNIKN